METCIFLCFHVENLNESTKGGRVEGKGGTQNKPPEGGLEGYLGDDLSAHRM